MNFDPATIKLLIRKNGLLWTSAFVTNALLRRLMRRDLAALERLMFLLEQRLGIPGVSDNEIHRRVWQNWNWKRGGEEWTESERWKRSLIEHVLWPNIGPGGRALEIGPGAGRWSALLVERADSLAVVDISSRCIEQCRARFAGRDNVDYYVNDGESLPFLDDASVDYVWSFDVFVHIAPRVIDSYLSEIARVLRPAGRAVIHHAKDGGLHGGARSRMTAQLFASMLARHQLELVGQFDSWGEEGRYDVKHHHDVITVFSK